MIVKKIWSERSNGGLTFTVNCGWYLFGIVPLYIIRRKVDS